MPSSGSEVSETTVASGGAGLKKGPWTAAEDAVLLEYVKKHGEGNWNAVQRNSGLSRCGKSCRLRWANHLRPNLKKGSFSPEEERLILELHAKMGNKWARMAVQMPGRTDNEIKNYWNTRIKRRQRAGLPLYPPEIQRIVGSNPLPPAGQQFAAAIPGPSSSLGVIPFNLSLTPPSQAPLFGNPRSAFHPREQTAMRLKRPREDSMVAPFDPRPLQALSPPMAFQYGSCGNYDDVAAASLSQYFSMKMELPSNQLYPPEWPRDNSGLLDALLVEAQAVSGGNESRSQVAESALRKGRWVEDREGGCGGGVQGAPSPELQETPVPEAPIPWDTRKKMKSMEQSGEDELSALLDIMPAEPMPMALRSNNSNWYSADSGDLQSNGQSSMIGDGGMVGTDLQRLAASVSMGVGDHKWSSGSPLWSSAPGIC